MRRSAWAGFLLLLVLALARAAAPLPVDGAALPDKTRELLEKSLSVVEIDREIERISSLRQQTQAEIDRSERELARQEIAIAVQREQAGRVLRSYYMGRNDMMWAAILNAGSLSELLRTWEMMDLVIQADRDVMNRYTEEFRLLRDGYGRLQRDKDELAGVERNLKEQRERLLGLQEEIERALSESGDEAHLRQLMAEMDAYWKNVGLFEVRRHFRALAEAMQELPDWLQEHPETLERKGLKAKLTLTDSQLNEFLQSRNEAFRHFKITFANDRMTLAGDNGNLQIAIGGRYSIQEEPENAIRFHVETLTFNGLELPDTTRADLEREFDLGFYPSQLIQFVKAHSVALEPGLLIVELRIG